MSGMHFDSPADMPEGMRKLYAQKTAAPANDQRRGTESKYHSIKDDRGRIRFDSKKEARRYDELMLRLQIGEIKDLRLQPQFTLQESYITPEGYRIRAMRYTADFSYYRATKPDITGKVYWIHVVEDVKSKATRTREYIMKRKLMHEKFGIDITEV
jgi:hypothetical protein